MRTCYCLLITTDARCIGELLQKNTVLELLWMGWNNICDDGITIIAGALGKSRIRKLSVYQCGITVTGAKALATGLSFNRSITLLDVWNNPITVEGACLILHSAVNNGICEEVSVNDQFTNDNYQSDYEIRKMMTILQTRREANKR